MVKEELTNVLTKLRLMALREAQRADLRGKECSDKDNFEDMNYQDGLHDGYACASRWIQLVLENDEKFVKLLDSQDDPT